MAEKFLKKNEAKENELRENELRKLIMDVFNPKKSENVIFLNDFPFEKSLVDSDYICRRKMTQEWRSAFLKLGKEIGFDVEEIITFEPTGKPNGVLPKFALQNNKKISFENKLNSLRKKDIVLAITKYSATSPLNLLLIKKHQMFRAASMPGARSDMSAFKADYKLVADKVNILAGLLSRAEGAEVIFSTGHKFYFDLRKREGEADDGNCRDAGKLINLPSGEAFIAPYEGFDKKLGESRTKGFLPVFVEADEKNKKEILVYEVNENKIIRVHGKSRKAKYMNEFFQEDPARANIAELGLGCNEKAVFIGETLQDEKIEGMHWAYGLNAHFKGGQIGVNNFKRSENALHQDVVYGNGLPIGIREIKLVYYDKTKEVIMKNNNYCVNFRR